MNQLSISKSEIFLGFYFHKKIFSLLLPYLLDLPAIISNMKNICGLKK
jgi:hypothetical protein